MALTLAMLSILFCGYYLGADHVSRQVTAAVREVDPTTSLKLSPPIWPLILAGILFVCALGTK
jgi:Na+/proline symporter